MVYAIAAVIVQAQIPTRFAFEPLSEVIKHVLGPETKVARSIAGVPVYARVDEWNESTVSAFRRYLTESLNLELVQEKGGWSLTRTDRYYPNPKLIELAKQSADDALSSLVSKDGPGIGRITTVSDIVPDVLPLLGSALEDYSRVVFATNPTPWERPLPPAALERLIEIYKLAPNLAGNKFVLSAYRRRSDLYFDYNWIDQSGVAIKGGNSIVIRLKDQLKPAPSEGDVLAPSTSQRSYIASLLERKPNGQFYISNGSGGTAPPMLSQAFGSGIDFKSGQEMLAQSYREQALTPDQRKALVSTDPWSPLMESYLDAEYVNTRAKGNRRVFALLPDNLFFSVLNLWRSTPRHVSMRSALRSSPLLNVVTNESGIEIRPATSSTLMINMSNRSAMRRLLEATSSSEAGTLKSILSYSSDENPVGADHLLPMHYGYLATNVDAFLYDLCTYDYMVELRAIASVPPEILNQLLGGKQVEIGSLPTSTINALRSLFLNHSYGSRKQQTQQRITGGKTFNVPVAVLAERTSDLSVGTFERGKVSMWMEQSPILKVEDSLRKRSAFGQLDRLAPLFQECMISPQKVWQGDGRYYVLKIHLPNGWTAGCTVADYDMSRSRLLSEDEFKQLSFRDGMFAPLGRNSKSSGGQSGGVIKPLK